MEVDRDGNGLLSNINMNKVNRLTFTDLNQNK